VDNDGTANDALGTNKLDQLVGLGALAIALSISLEVSEITDMASLIIGSTVGLSVWVEVGSGGCAAVGVVTELMDVEAALGIGVVTRDIPCNGGWGRLGRLLEGNGTGDLRVTSDGSNCFDHFDGFDFGFDKLMN